MGQAQRAGLQHVVLLSALGADADPSAPMRQAELHLEQSGLAWNTLRPNWFMQNFHTFWLHGIQTQGQILLPVGDAQGSFIDTRDIAAVAARLLSSDTFVTAAHDLTGSESLDHTQVAAILSKASGSTIDYNDIQEDTIQQSLLGAGLPPGALVLDACAAPGGKTAQLLERADLDLLALDSDPRRVPRHDVFIAGQLRPELGMAAQDGVLSELPVLPRTCDAATTAIYIQSVLSGEKPAPPSITAQVNCILRALEAMNTLRDHKHSA